MSAVPVHNLFVMLAYACHDAGLLDNRAIGACNFERPLDLVGHLLDSLLRRLRRRGIDSSYKELQEQGAVPRGALHIHRTITQLLHVKGELAWNVDELLPDTPANRILKAALRALLSANEVSLPVRQSLRAHVVWMHGVAEVPAREALRIPATIPRALPEYRTALRLARLALAQLLPNLGNAGTQAQSLSRDPEQMGQLFESFVRGFAAFELRGQAKVKSRHLNWDAKAKHEQSLTLLPIMRTDLYLEWQNGRVSVGECKFYERPLLQAHRSDETRLRSGHLYQLIAYLRAAERTTRVKPEGILLYARSGIGLDEHWTLEGYPLRLFTIDLAQEWHLIRPSLLQLLTESAP